VDLMLAVVDPADGEALELLCYMRRKHRQVPVIVLFSAPSPERAKDALRQGALAVLRFPLPATELRAAVTQALAPRAPGSVPSAFPAGHSAPGGLVSAPAPGPVAQPQPPYVAGGPQAFTLAAPTPAGSFSTLPPTERVARELGIVGCDPSLRQAIELAGTIASTRTPVLILGEPGTGKALLAHMIHALGVRRDQALVTFDNSALTDVPAEPGRASDARNGRADVEGDWSTKVQQAHGGTLFINEVSALSDSLQAQLLQALQEREFEPNGLHGIAPDVRVLMSSSDNLPTLVEQGGFRHDLYYRISVICLKLPPLRHRTADIESLAEYFRTRFSQEFGKAIIGFTHDALESLMKYEWPGNIRELKAVIRRGVILCQGSRITSGHLASSLSYPRSSRTPSAGTRPHLALAIRPLKEALEEPEKRIIIQALQALNWNRQETARVLDINRTTLYKKMKKYGLLVDTPSWVN
jgi:two-component system response regulator HydG